MSTKIYFVRHQAAGTLHDLPFSYPPSESQLAAIERRCFQRHGASHPKTPDEPYWLKVEAVDVLGANDVPEVAEQGLSVANSIGLPGPTISGVGHVKNRGE